MISENQISAIVDQIVNQIKRDGVNVNDPNSRDVNYLQDGVFTTIDDAIIAAKRAQKEFTNVSLNKRVEIIETVRQHLRDNVNDLAKMAVEETDLGRVPDKIIKNLLVINKTPGPEILDPHAYTNEHGMMMIERTAWGVIGSITPTTNPSETIICNGIGFIAACNSAVFNPHPRAKQVSAHTIRLINKAIVSVGGPPNLLTCVSNPTIESAGNLMKHPGINLLVVTGGPGVVNAAFKSGKKVICGGPGNPPAVVDETAFIEKAGRDIVMGHSFDNNVICTDEKTVITVNSIADKLKEAMKQAGAYEISSSQIDRLCNVVLADKGESRMGCPGHAKPNYVGKNASVLLGEIGINVKDDVRTVLCDVPNDHPLIWTEQLMPILPLTRCPDMDSAIKLAIESEHGYKHTASVHSKNIDNITKMGQAFQGSIFVNNAPNYAGLGEGGSGYTSFTIASPTGDGLTTALSFSRERRMTLVDSFRIV
jgi:propionaldehyde dehydrogenase